VTSASLRISCGVVAGTIALFGSLAMSGPGNAQTGNASTGQALYQAKCGGCHSLDANRIGPAHRGVVGRKIASAPAYAYSSALKRLGGVWTPARLDLWLQNPQRLAPGSKMFLMVGDAGQRRDVIAYLAANSPAAAAR